MGQPQSRSALASFAALGQEARLAIFRALVAAGPGGLTATEAAEATGVRQNTFSTHVAILQRAGLVRSRRDGRSIIYRADLDGLLSLIHYLLEDCCGGRPELCAPLLAELGPLRCG